MSTGWWALQGILVVTAFAAITSLQRAFGIRLNQHVPRALALVAGALSAIALGFLLHIFLSTDLSYVIVHSYSSADMPTMYKLSGSWAGPAGSMVFWLTVLLIFWVAEELRWWRRESGGLTPEEEPVPERTRKGRKRQKRRTLAAKQAERRAAPPKGYLTLDLVRGIVMVVAMVLTLATIALEPFETFEEGRIPLPEGGRGLNPALRTPLMAVHPPIVFMAYALITVVFAASMAYLVRRDPAWADLARPSARLAWLTLTLGIGIGAMWAYVTLGWGGYWAWDPVETSSLIPWIALTAFLHALVSYDRGRQYTYLAPLLGGLSMFLVFFATFVTRSGVWQSVHAYAGASAESALDRISEALSGSVSLWWIYWSMWGVLIFSVIGVLYRFWKAQDDSPMLPEMVEGESRLEWLARGRVSMFATVFLLSVSMLLVLLIMVATVGSTLSGQEYNARVAVFVVPLMAFLVICMAARYLHRRRAATFAGAALLAGLVAWVVNPGDLDPAIAWFGATVGLFGIVAVVGQPVAIARSRRAVLRRLVRRSGSVLLHLGLAMVFMGYCLSNVPTLPETSGRTSSVEGPVAHDGYEAFVTDREWETNTGVTERNEHWDTFRGTVRLERDGKALSDGQVEVISSFEWRETGTLTYRDPVTGEMDDMDGEVVDSELAGGGFWIRFRSLREPYPYVDVDLFDTDNSLGVWPALHEDQDLLEGQYMRISNDTRDWYGFLVSVEDVTGNVTMTVGGQETSIPGTEVERVYRRAYTEVVMRDVFIHRDPFKDVYVAVLYARPTEGGFVAEVMVLEVPGIAMLWTGMFMMAAGVLMRPLELRVKGNGGGSDGAPAEMGDGTPEGTKEANPEEDST